MVEELKEERMEWIPESRARNAAFRDILSAGDRRELIVLVNTVRERMEQHTAMGKKPTGTDENAVRRAKKMLFEEFAITTDIADEEAVLSLLRGELTLGPKSE